MGVQLPDDIGEWVCDGVVLCEVVNRLHPGLIPNISRPSSGAVSWLMILETNKPRLQTLFSV